MEFLKPYLAFANTNSNLEETASLTEETAEGHEQQAYDQPEEPSSPGTTHTSISNRPSMLPNAVVPPSTTIMETTDKSKQTQKRKRQNTADQEIPRKKSNNTSTTSNVETVLSYLGKRNELDAVDHLFLSWAKTIKTFSPRRLLDTKMQIANIIMQQERNQLEEDIMNQQPSPYSIRSVDTSATTSRSTPVTSEGTVPMSLYCETFSSQEPQATPVEATSVIPESEGLTSFFQNYG